MRKPRILARERAARPDAKARLRRAAAGAVAVVTSASVVLGGMFHSPSALPERESLVPPPPIVLDEDSLDGDGKNKQQNPPEPESAPETETVAPAEAEPALPEEERKGLRSRWASLSMSQRLLFVPLAALVCWGVFGLGAAFLPGLLGLLAHALTPFAALTGGFVAAEKALSPDTPVRELLSRRRLRALLSGAAALSAADFALSLLWSGYARFAPLLRGGVCALCLIAALLYTARTKRERAAQKNAQEAVPEPEAAAEARPLTKADILALADTVSRKRRE